MQKVQLHIDLAPDGSGWSLSTDHPPRDAYIWKTPDETSHSLQYFVIVPLSDEEKDNFQQNIITKNGVTGLKVTNVNNTYIDF